MPETDAYFSVKGVPTFTTQSIREHDWVNDNWVMFKDYNALRNKLEEINGIIQAEKEFLIYRTECLTKIRNVLHK